MFKSLTPTLSILTAILLFVFFINPQLDLINETRAQIETYETTIEQYKVFNSKVRNLMDAKESISIADRERLEKLIPSTPDSTRTLVDLETMAKQDGLLFGNVASTKPEPIMTETEDAYAIMEPSEEVLLRTVISFEVIGTYEQFKSFISHIENNLELMEITELSLAGATANFQQYVVTLQTYSLSTL